MAQAPSAEPFKTICLQKGYLTPEKAEELAKLQAHLAERLDLPTEFLDLCKQKSALSDAQIEAVKQAAGNANASRNKPAIKELAGFEILGKAGEGAMGVVYKARQKSLDRVVALKILPPRFAKNKVFVERFIREARASAALNHPNIVQGIDVGEAQGLYYFAMEFIDGETVNHRFKKEGPLPLEDVLEIGRQTALALGHAHGKGMIHRDIKPDNLMLAKSGTSNKKAFTVKVMDLGLARMVEDDASMTESGKALGTPHYISPEQARGDKDLTPKCDLYSLGCTLLHIASGKTPYQGETSAVVMSKHLVEAPPDPRKLKPDMPADVAAILGKLMAKKPEERYPSAEALAEDLERVLRGEKPKMVAIRGGHGKSTGPVRPVTGKAGGVGTTGKKRPVDAGDETSKQKAQPKSNPLIYVGAGAGVLLALVGVGLAFSGGEKEKPKTEERRAKETPAPSAPKGPTTAELEAQAKAKREAEAATRQRKLEGLQQVALEVEQKEPENLDKVRQAWLDLRSEGIDTPFQKTADERLDALAARVKAAAENAVKTLLETAGQKAKDGDYDGALGHLGTLDPKYKSEAAQKSIDELAKTLSDKAQAEGAARLKDAADLLAAGKKEEALKGYQDLAHFKFKPVADDAAKLAEGVGKVIEEEKMQAEIAATELFAKVTDDLARFVQDRKLDEAQTALTRALNDRTLAPKSDLLRVVAEGLNGFPSLNDLVAKRLETAGPAGVSLDGKATYYKLENGRLQFKPSPDFPQMSSKGAEYIPPKEMLELAGLKSDQAAKALAQVPKDEIVMLGSLLALLGEADSARKLFERGKAEGGPALAKRLEQMDDALEIMQHGAAEGTAAAQLASLKNHANAERWREAKAALDNLSGPKLSGTEFVKAHFQEIAGLTTKVMAGLLDAEADSVPVEDLFKGKVRALGGNAYELVYDFESPEQLADFKITQGNWEVRDGRLRFQQPPNDGMVFLKAAFAGDALEVSYDGEAPRGEANCLLAPEIKQDTTHGYSFRFGRTNNQLSEALTSGDRSLVKSRAKMNNGLNKLFVARRGNSFTGQLNGPNDALSFTVPDPLPSRHVAFQTWEAAQFDNVRIVGKFDPDWLKSARRTHLMSKLMAQRQAETAKTLSAQFKGKFTDLGNGKAKLEYDFSDPAQVADFDTSIGIKPQAMEGKLGFGGGVGLTFHKARWRPPFTVSFQGFSKNGVAMMAAHTGQGENIAEALKVGTGLSFGNGNKVRLTLHGQQVHDHDYTFPGAGATVDISFDGRRWYAASDGKAVIDWTDTKPDAPETHNRMGFAFWNDQRYGKIVITGNLDPAWVEQLSGKPAAAKPPAPQETAEAREPKGPPPPPENAKEKPPAPPPPPEKGDPKVLKTYYKKVQADLLMQDSQWNIREGTPVRITAQGKWADTPNSQPVGPDGDKERKHQGLPLWSLIAKSSGNANPMLIGSKWEGNWPGRMFLQMNDDPKRLKYSPGEMVVTIEVLDRLPDGANGEKDREHERDREKDREKERERR
ncbi:MAG: protein kinase [Planctomycetota bacterium]|nr:protein kinase [Planctomycetota bacterium]